MSVTLIVLVCVATYRLTRLVTEDAIMLPVRVRLETRPWLGYLVTCRWCLSVWVGCGLSALVSVYGESVVLVAVLVGLTASAVAGLLSRLE